MNSPNTSNVISAGVADRTTLRKRMGWDGTSGRRDEGQGLGRQQVINVTDALCTDWQRHAMRSEGSSGMLRKANQPGGHG